MGQSYKNSDKGEEESEKKIPSTQAKFEDIFSSEIPQFVDILQDAHRLTMQDLRHKGLKYQMRMTKSTLMNGNIRGLLFDSFPDEVKDAKSGRFYFHRRSEFILLFKKLRENLLPSNIGTKNARRILSQMAFDFDEDLPIVFIGFVVDKTWEQLKKIVAVYIYQGKIQWVTDLLDFEGGNSQLDLFSTGPLTGPDDDLIVTPKRKKDDALEAS